MLFIDTIYRTIQPDRRLLLVATLKSLGHVGDEQRYLEPVQRRMVPEEAERIATGRGHTAQWEEVEKTLDQTSQRASFD